MSKRNVLNEVEEIKRARGLDGGLREDLRDSSRPDLDGELEQIAKSHGIYLQFNRARSGREKDWMYMIRLAVPGGGPIQLDQWHLLLELARKHAVNPAGQASLRLTTRQAVQFHWVNKQGVLDIVKTAAEQGLKSLNACGDNVRNLMACPLADADSGFDAQRFAHQLAKWFELPLDPFIQVFAIDPNALDDAQPGFEYGDRLLNRKFKIAVSAAHRLEGKWILDNCVEVRTHDLGFTPLIEDGQVNRLAIWLGGGQGEKFGKPTASLMAQPFAEIPVDRVAAVANAIVAVHRDWGDRENRHHARIKYLVRDRGVNWFRDRVNELLDTPLSQPTSTWDPGPRHLHHGWLNHENDYGLWVENGRLSDYSANGKLLSLTETLMNDFSVTLMITANQDLVFKGIAANDKGRWERTLLAHGYGQRHLQPYSALRLRSGACVGKDTCRLAYTDSENFEPQLIEELEGLGWGDLRESIGVTGCERQCFRPATKTIGLVGSGLNRYLFKFGGSEDGRHQGQPLRSNGLEYLRSVPRDRVSQVLNTLFHIYQAQCKVGESLGDFNRRLGSEGLIECFQAHPQTADLMAKGIPFKEYRDEFDHRFATTR